MLILPRWLLIVLFLFKQFLNIILLQALLEQHKKETKEGRAQNRRVNIILAKKLYKISEKD